MIHAIFKDDSLKGNILPSPAFRWFRYAQPTAKFGLSPERG